MTSPRIPLVLFHLSPVTNRRGINRYGLKPVLSRGKREHCWFFELTACDKVYSHLTTLRGQEDYDLWLVRTMKGGRFIRCRDEIWTSPDPIPAVGLMRLCQIDHWTQAPMIAGLG